MIRTMITTMITTMTTTTPTASRMAEIDDPSNIETPCNKVCVLDAASGLCIGCGRTGAEIGSWIGKTAEERRRIMAELPARLAALPRPPRNS